MLTLTLLGLHPLALQLRHVQPLLRVLVSDVLSGRQHLQRVPGRPDVPGGTHRPLVLHHGRRQPGAGGKRVRERRPRGLTGIEPSPRSRIGHLLRALATKDGVEILADLDPGGHAREFGNASVELGEDFVVQLHHFLHCPIGNC